MHGTLHQLERTSAAHAFCAEQFGEDLVLTANDCGFNATLRDYARLGQLYLDQGGGVIPAGWVAATRDANPSVFGAPYTEVLPGGAYRNQWWVEDTQSRALYARGVFGQMISVNWDHRMVAVKLSSWPEFQNPNLTRATMRALHAIAEHLS